MKKDLEWKLTLAKKLIANDKITPSCQTNLSSKYFIKRYNNKNILWKLLGEQVFPIPFNLLYFCPSVRCFVSTVLFLPSFTVLRFFKMFCSIWWQFPLFECRWWISWHRSFNLFSFTQWSHLQLLLWLFLSYGCISSFTFASASITVFKWRRSFVTCQTNTQTTKTNFR